MAPFTDEELSAYLDAELTPEKASIIEQAIETDAELRLRLKALAEVNEVLRRSYGNGHSDKVPGTIEDMIADYQALRDDHKASVLDFDTIRSQRRRVIERFTPIAAAASIALIIGGGFGFLFGNGYQPNINHTDNMIAGVVSSDSLIHEVLETYPSSSEAVDAGVRVAAVLSFQTNAGGYCREFVVQGGQTGSRNVACRDSGEWVVVASAVELSTELSDQFYITASGQSGSLIDQYVAGVMVGDAMSAEVEMDLIEGSWSRSR